MMTSCPASKVVPWMRWFCHHFAVFSVAIPRSSARTCAATADGASPTTEPGPCSCFPGAAERVHGGCLARPGGTDEHVEHPS